MTAPRPDSSLLIPVPLTVLLEQAEERHGAAMRTGHFDRADQWRRVRDGLVDLLYRPGDDR